MAKHYATRDCDCTAEMWPGQKRPKVCEHGNRFQTEAELKPRERAPLRSVSPKREAEEAAGKRPRRRGSTLKQGNGFAVVEAQRAKVRGLVCVGCGQEASEWSAIDPAHLWPRGKGGCDHPDCVIPLCRHSREDGEAGCHRRFDEGRLELLPSLIDKGYWVEMAHPILRHEVSPYTLVDRLTLCDESSSPSLGYADPVGTP